MENEYKIIQSDDGQWVARRVEKALNEGYELSGDLQITTRESRHIKEGAFFDTVTYRPYTWYTQPIKKLNVKGEE